jgi:hypothetical protein
MNSKYNNRKRCIQLLPAKSLLIDLVDHNVQLDGYFEVVLVFREIQRNLNTCKERKKSAKRHITVSCIYTVRNWYCRTLHTWK